MGKRGPKPAEPRVHIAHGYADTAKRRIAADGTVRPPVWDRARPPEKAILPPSRAIQLIPGYDPNRDAGDTKFHPAVAKRVVRWFHNHITHVKGDLTGQPYVLAPIEQAIVGNLFGWLRPNGLRRYRKSLVYVARKFSKTTLSAGVALYGFFEEVGGCSCPLCRAANYGKKTPPEEYAEGGVESYAAAYTRDQAKLLWGPAKQMIRSDEHLRGRCRIYQHSIVRYSIGTTDDDGSYFQAISADANSAHGLNPYICTVDELHTQKTADLLDALDTGTGSRAQPLSLRITTADFDRESICNEEYKYACSVRDGLVVDPEYLPVIFEASQDDDPFVEATWKKANPKYPDTPKPVYLEAAARKAKENLRFRNTFLRLHLNIRTQADVAWFDMAQWDACAKAVNAGGLRGRPCFAGLDLASVSDLTAFVLLFPEDDNAVLPFFWVPAATAKKRETRGIMPSYITFSQQGLMELTPGQVCDYDFVRTKINELGELYDVKGIAFDRWGATQLSTQLEGDGFEMVSFGQGYASLSAPAKELEKLVIGSQFHHGGHPVLRWNAGNVMLETDAAGNIKPSKKKSTDKIDGIVALVMALGLSIAADQPEQFDPEVMVI